VAYHADFVTKYCSACGEAVHACSVLVVRSQVPECIVQVGEYSVDGMLGSKPKELEVIGGGLVRQVWGWLENATRVCVMEIPMRSCPHVSRRIIECKLELCSPLIRALNLEAFLAQHLFATRFG